MYNESIKLPTTSDNSLTPILDYYGSKVKVYKKYTVYKQTDIQLITEK